MSDVGSSLRIDSKTSGLVFWIHVSPRSRTARVAGVHGDALRVAVTAPPLEGKANVACIKALADALGLRKSAITLDPASKGRRKRVEVSGPPAALRARLERLASTP